MGLFLEVLKRKERVDAELRPRHFQHVLVTAPLSVYRRTISVHFWRKYHASPIRRTAARFAHQSQVRKRGNGTKVIHRSVGKGPFFLTGSVIGQSVRAQVHGDLIPCVDHVHKPFLALVRVKLVKARQTRRAAPHGREAR